MATHLQNLGLSALPEIDQKQYPQIYAELIRIRNALGVIQSVLDTLGGGTVGQQLTKVTAADYDYVWA